MTNVNTPMHNQRPILILYASAGAGHLSAANAVAQALQARLPDARIEVHDALERTNVVFRAIYARGYLAIANHAPLAMGVLYDLTDRPEARGHGLREEFQMLNAHPLARWLRRRRPRLIINTHFFPAEIVSALRRRGRLDCPQFVVTTDFDTHRIWRQSPTERFFTATPDGKAYLERCGADPACVRAVGIPVRAVFHDLPAQREARSMLGLPGDRPLVLLLCGGFGVGPIQCLFRELLPLRAAAQIVAITGRNVRLRKQLTRIAASARHAHVIGHTERMSLWMRAADIGVSKPGGLTCAEALVCGLPLVLVHPIPGQEARNRDHLLERGAAIYVKHDRLLAHRVRELLSDDRRREELRANSLKSARPAAADSVAEEAVRLLRERAIHPTTTPSNATL